MELKCSAQQKKLKRLPTEWEKCQQYIWQGINNQDTQGTQTTKLPKSVVQWTE
jgi:hypothetical protein